MLKKRPFTLLEVIISLSLVVLVLSTLMFFYRYTSQLDVEMKTLQNESFQLRYMQSRLAWLFSRAGAEHFSGKDGDEEKLLFFSTPSGLTLTYDNGVILDVRFANDVIGRLFIDDKKRFCLATWPRQEDWPSSGSPPVHLEVLMEGVESIKWEFLSQNTKDENLPDLSPNQWYGEWKRQFKSLPAVVRMNFKLVDEKEAYSFAFPLIHVADPK